MTYARIPDELQNTIREYSLSGNAVAVHISAIQMSLAGRSDGIVTAQVVRTLMRQFDVRKRENVLRELLTATICGGHPLWSDLGDGRYEIYWEGQQTPDQKAVSRANRNKRQADYVSRNALCAGGDHSMCEGTKRKCQRGKGAHANGVRTPPHSTPPQATPVSVGGVEYNGAETPPSLTAGADAPPTPAPEKIGAMAAALDWPVFDLDNPDPYAALGIPHPVVINNLPGAHP